MRKPIVWATLLLAVATAVPAQQSSVDQFFEAVAADWVRSNPNLATANRYFTGEEQRQLERDLTPVDEAYQRARIERARRGLGGLEAFDRAQMTDAQRLSADVLKWQLTAIVDGAPFLDHTYPFEQFRGVNITIVDALTVQQPLTTRSDMDNFLARLNRVPVRISEAIAEARRIERKGIVPPRFILRATIDQMRQFVGSPADQNPLITTMAPKLDALSEVSLSDRASLRAEAVRAVDTQVYPAWRAAIAALETMLPGSSDDAGLWRFTDGPATYEYQLRLNTTTRLTPDEIHQIGLTQVARIEGEMGAILARLGRTDGTLQARIDQLRTEQGYPLTDEGRAQIMRDIDVILKDAQVRSRDLFELTPKAAVVAEAYPRFREASAAGQYIPPSSDGTRPGTFRIPLRPSNMTRFGLRSLVYHETVPGHHYQIALGREDKDLPRFRQLAILGGLPAFGEGWGLYAERLAADSGWYNDDLIGQLGQLDAELFRARRLVVDTGLHAKKLTRQQAIDYGIEASEIDRYVVNPGQACAYMLGQLKLIELRERARQALGPRFSLRAFHTSVQRAGALPLELLDREVDRFIAAQP